MTTNAIGRNFGLNPCGIFFALLLLVATCGLARAQYTTSSDGNGGVIITGYNGTPPNSLNIPNSVNGQTVTGIGGFALAFYTNLTNVSIPNTVTNIGTDAFDDDSLTSLTIPSSVTSIGLFAFAGNDMTSVTVPASVATLAAGAFASCSQLSNVTLLNSFIGQEEFENCNALANVTIPNNVTSIGVEAFSGSGLTNISIPSSVTSIGESAFYQSKLTSVTIPASVTNFGDQVFDGCAQLTSVTFLGNITSYGESEFNGCTSLANVSIPSTVTNIGSSAFRNCTALKSITIPSSVATIGDHAFDSSGLTSVNISNGVTTIEDYAFASTSLTSVTVPASVTNIQSEAFLTPSLTSFTVSAQNTSYSSLNGVLYGAHQTTLVQYPIGNTASSFSIPNTVTSIGEEAFSTDQSLTSVTVPASVTSISDEAFAYCSNLLSATFQGNAPEMGGAVFYDTATDFTVFFGTADTGFSSPTWTDSGGDTYNAVGGPYGQWTTTPDGNGGLLITGYTGTSTPVAVGLPTAIYGQTVTGVADNAFKGALLTMIVVPNTITTIGNSAFANCPNLIYAFFSGDAPTMGTSVFQGAASGFQVDYAPGTNGFGTPTWTDSSGNSYPAVARAPSISLNIPTNFTYDGNDDYTITATTFPANLTYSISGGGGVNAGNYTITGKITDPAFSSVPAQTGNLTIGLATQETYNVTLPSTLVVGATYTLGPFQVENDGQSFVVSYMVTQGNATISGPDDDDNMDITINGPGPVTVQTTVSGGPNFNPPGSTNNTNPTGYSVPIQVNNLAASFGSAYSVTWTTNPTSLHDDVAVSYSNSNDQPMGTTPPTAEGTYFINASLNNAILTNPSGTYTGTGTGTLTITGPPVVTNSPAAATVSAGSTVNFTAAASGYPVPTVQWQVSTNGGSLYANITGNSSAFTNTLTFSTTSSQSGYRYRAVYTNSVASVNSNAALLTVSQPVQAATITLSNLSPTYNGSPQQPTAVTNPTGLNVGYTYINNSGGASVSEPVNVGSYTVTATITTANYSGSKTGTLTIAKAAAGVLVPSTTVNYGSPSTVAVTTTPAGLSKTVTYSNSSYPASTTPPTAPGNYTVAATLTDPNYTGSGSGILIIAKATASVALTPSSLSATYNGSAQLPTATTNPTGLTVGYTYVNNNGGASVAQPVNAGSYTVTATISNVDYTGSTTGTLTISKATASVFVPSTTVNYGSPSTVAVTTTPSGLSKTVTYSNSSFPASTAPPTAPGTYTVAATVTDPNYSGSNTGTLVINGATAVVTLTPSSLNATYTGKVVAAAATTNPAGLVVKFSYIQNGKTASPVNAGSYLVTASVNTASVSASTTGTLTISPAAAIVTLGGLTQLFTGKPISATATTVPAKLPVSFTYDGNTVPPMATGAYTVMGTISNPNYLGSSTGTLTITPVPPLPTTGAATLIAAQGATLNGTVNPKGTATTAYFQYNYVANSGTVTLTSGTTPMSAVATSVPIVAPVSGLLPGTLYHVQMVANNGVSTVIAAAKTFTTLAEPVINPPAPAVQAPAPLRSASGVEVSANVNPSGVATSVYVMYGINSNNLNQSTGEISLGAGKTAVIASVFLGGLAANTPYYYEVFTVSAAGTFHSSIGTFTTLNFDTTLVAATGLAPANGLPTFATLAAATLDAADGAAFRATISGAAAASNTGIYANVANRGLLTLVAQTGSSAPGTAGIASGADFSALTDPVYNDNGDLAFGGTLKVAAGLVTATTENGVWASDDGTLSLLAREGSVAPGTGGALFATFTATGISVQGGGIVAGTLTNSAALGVTASNNQGVWEGANPATLRLMLRTGETTGAKTISSFKFMPVDTYVNGQTREFAPTTGHLAVTATFTDKTSGIVDVTTTAGAPAAVATAGEVAAGTSGATFTTFGSPAIDDNDDVAFSATLKVGVGDAALKNDSGVWAGYGAGTPGLIARLGEIAPGTATSAAFLTFGDPVENANGAVAFRATLSTGAGAATATTNTGIWCDSTGQLELVARTGEAAPGCLTGVTISALSELALANINGATHQGGVIFLATLTGTGVTSSNNSAIFSVDNTGTVQLIVRTGDVLNAKTVSVLTFLPPELSTGNAPVSGQSRSFSQGSGDLVYNATFTDKSQAIFNVVFP